MDLSIQATGSYDAAAAATFTANLTPDALMTYLSTRLDGLDAQVNGVFNRQQQTQAIQKKLADLRTALGQVKFDVPPEQNADAIAEVNRELDDLTKLDPNMGPAIREQLNTNGFAFGDNDNCSAAEMERTTKYLDGVCKDIESSAQMDMIRLQSVMSARQTAIQLSTNLVSALGESTKSIVANIGR